MQKAWIPLLLIALSAACNRSAQESVAAPATNAPAQPAAPAPSAPRASAVPANPHEPSASAADLNSPAHAGGLQWKAPKPLTRTQPKTTMRAAQYSVEGGDGAELAVFYFGPNQGGAVEPNIARWLGQFTQPDGSDSRKKAKRNVLEVSGVTITTIEVTGTYSGGMGMPSAHAPASQPDSMLLGAIALGPSGPVFFKLTGPRASVERARSAFDAMLHSIQRG